MAKHSEYFSLRTTVGRASEACRAVFAADKWKIQDDSGWAFLVKDNSNFITTLYRNPIKFAVFLRADDEDGRNGVNVELTGSTFGFGPLPRSRLRKKAAELHARIKAALAAA